MRLLRRFFYQSGEFLLGLLDDLAQSEELLDLDGRLLLVDVDHLDLALGAGGARLEDLDELLLLILNGAPFGEERTVGRLASLSVSQVRSTEVIIGFNPD